MRTSLAVAVALLPACAAAATAQERGDTLGGRRGLPRDVAREAAALFNATTGLRVVGPLEIEAGREVAGDVAVLNGPLTLDVHVTGRVIALNSDVILRPSARIDGDLLVVGGEVAGRDVAEIGGEIRIYRDALHYRQEGDQIVAERDTLVPGWTVSVVRRWKYLLVGADNEDQANQIAQRLQGELPGGARLEVEPSGTLAWQARPSNPFAVFGGLGG